MDIDPNSNSDSDSESVKSVDSGELDQGLQITDYKKKKSRRKKKSENENNFDQQLPEIDYSNASNGITDGTVNCVHTFIFCLGIHSNI